MHYACCASNIALRMMPWRKRKCFQLKPFLILSFSWLFWLRKKIVVVTIHCMQTKSLLFTTATFVGSGTTTAIITTKRKWRREDINQRHSFICTRSVYQLPSQHFVQSIENAARTITSTSTGKRLREYQWLYNLKVWDDDDDTLTVKNLPSLCEETS